MHKQEQKREKSWGERGKRRRGRGGKKEEEEGEEEEEEGRPGRVGITEQNKGRRKSPNKVLWLGFLKKSPHTGLKDG